MYRTIFYYLGGKSMEMGQATKNLLFIIMFVSATALFFRSRVIPKNEGILLLFVITIAYIAILYFYNLSTVLNLGVSYGFQGRYLLPVLGFIYLGIALGFTHNEIIRKVGIPLKVALIALFTFTLLWLNPVNIFLRKTDSTWHSDLYQRTVIKTKEALPL